MKVKSLSRALSDPMDCSLLIPSSKGNLGLAIDSWVLRKGVADCLQLAFLLSKFQVFSASQFTHLCYRLATRSALVKNLESQSDNSRNDKVIISKNVLLHKSHENINQKCPNQFFLELEN